MRRSHVSSRGKSLGALAPAVAAQFDELQKAISGLGEEIGAALAAQKQDAEREAQQAVAAERERQSDTIEAASPTRGFRAKETAQRLGIHQQTLWKWCREGRFPRGIKVGPMTTIWTEAMIAEALAQKAKQKESSASAGGKRSMTHCAAVTR